MDRIHFVQDVGFEASVHAYSKRNNVLFKMHQLFPSCLKFYLLMIKNKNFSCG